MFLVSDNLYQMHFLVSANQCQVYSLVSVILSVYLVILHY